MRKNNKMKKFSELLNSIEEKVNLEAAQEEWSELRQVVEFYFSSNFFC